MKINIFRFKTWMLIHMSLMNIFLICLIRDYNFQSILSVITIYFMACITDNGYSQKIVIAS